MKIYRAFIVILVLFGFSVLSSFAQGTGPVAGTKPFIMPVAGPSSPSTWILGQPYGNTTGAYITGANQYSAGQYLHFGVDIGMPCGTPVIAVADGIVDSVDNPYRGSAPHNLSLRFPELGLSALYGHLLERPLLVEGQIVAQGDVVGLSGDPEGDCDSRPHLHFEVRALNQSPAYNPILFIDAPWHSLLGLDSRTRPVFQRDLTSPRRWMSLEDQPDVVFGGRRLNDYTSTWPPAFYRGLPVQTSPDIPFTPVSGDWTLRQVGAGGCCAGPWWIDSNRLAFIDGIEGQIASIFEVWLNWEQPPAIVQSAPPTITSADGAFHLIYEPTHTTIRRVADNAQWRLEIPNNFPMLSPDNRLLLYTRGEGDGLREIWVAALDGSVNKAVWTSEGRNATARWLDSNQILLSEREPIPGRYTTMTVVQIEDSTTYSLGMWHGVRNVQIAPGGKRLIFVSSFNPDPANDGTFVLEIAPGAVPEKLPWFADYRWRDAESVFYITFDPATDIQQLNTYHVPTGEAQALTNPDTMPFTIANGDWSVSPDGRAIVFQEARDKNIWLLMPKEQP